MQLLILGVYENYWLNFENVVEAPSRSYYQYIFMEMSRTRFFASDEAFVLAQSQCWQYVDFSKSHICARLILHPTAQGCQYINK